MKHIKTRLKLFRLSNMLFNIVLFTFIFLKKRSFQPKKDLKKVISKLY